MTDANRRLYRMSGDRIRARIGLDLLHRYEPEAVVSPLGSRDLGIPEI